MAAVGTVAQAAPIFGRSMPVSPIAMLLMSTAIQHWVAAILIVMAARTGRISAQ